MKEFFQLKKKERKHVVSRIFVNQVILCELTYLFRWRPIASKNSQRSAWSFRWRRNPTHTGVPSPLRKPFPLRVNITQLLYNTAGRRPPAEATHPKLQAATECTNDSHARYHHHTTTRAAIRQSTLCAKNCGKMPCLSDPRDCRHRRSLSPCLVVVSRETRRIASRGHLLWIVLYKRPSERSLFLKPVQGQTHTLRSTKKKDATLATEFMSAGRGAGFFQPYS